MYFLSRDRDTFMSEKKKNLFCSQPIRGHVLLQGSRKAGKDIDLAGRQRWVPLSLPKFLPALEDSPWLGSWVRRKVGSSEKQT